MILAIKGGITGLDAFGHCDTFGRFLDEFVKGYALDSLDCFSKTAYDEGTPQGARRCISSVMRCSIDKSSSIGLGEDIRFESEKTNGAALVHDNTVLHLSAFRKNRDSRSPGTGYQRFSRRRRSRMD
ncbi:ARPP-1 family domain-containing protein [Thermodesulfobacteriota bacterium]